MEKRRHELNEAAVLYFRRDDVFEGVHLARVALRKGESSTFHKHTNTRDTFFVMSGRLTIVVRNQSSTLEGACRPVSVRSLEATADTQGGFVHRVNLVAGDVFIVEPGVVHCATNMDEAPCHFLCIEGVGEYDFVEVQ